MESYAVLWNNLDVFMAADEFDIAPLKQLARTRLINWIDKNADRLPFVVREIWARPLPPLETELQDAIISAISSHAQEFLKTDEGTAFLMDLPGITIEVLKKTLNENLLLELKLKRMQVRGRY